MLDESPAHTSDALRHDWSLEQIRAIYDAPLLDLVFRAAAVHRCFHDPAEVQVCKLISIKTGGLPLEWPFFFLLLRCGNAEGRPPLVGGGEGFVERPRADEEGGFPDFT